VNVFSPGNLQSCSKIAGVNFAEPILASIERKLEISKEFAGGFDNKRLAVM
jgi:glutathione synthase